MKSFFTLLLGWLLLSTGSFTHGQTAPPVTLPGTQVRTIRSSVLNGEIYQLLIHFPDNYDARKKYDVLFMLDGLSAFPSAIDCLGILHGDCANGYNEPLLIGISDGTMIGKPGNKRDRDFAPTAFKTGWGATGGGGAPKFLAFIEQEVIPFVGKNYPVTANRTLYGYSYGGLFASYALLTKPTLFNTVLIGSPSIWADDAVMLRTVEPNYARTHPDLPVNVWLSVGEKDENLLDDDKRFGEVLKSRNYPSLRLQTRILPGLNHLTAIHPTMLQALRWAYCENQLKP